MSELISETQTRIRVGDEDLLVIDGETALDGVSSVLSSERRRQALVLVCENAGEMDVSTLAERIADRLASKRSGVVSDETVRRLHASLYHQDLPKIASLGLLTYDVENQTVEATDAIGT